MSAAPCPPPHSSAGLSNGVDGSVGAQENGGRSSNRTSYGPPLDGSRQIDELRAEAIDRARNMSDLPMMHLLKAANDSVLYAERLANFRKRDQSYVEYMVASELIITLVPRHKDYPNLTTSKVSSANSLFRETVSKVKANYERFEKIKDIIVNDNRRAGVQPRNNEAAMSNPPRLSSIRPLSSQSSCPTSKRSSTPNDELFLHVPSNGHVNVISNGISERPRSVGTAADISPSTSPRPKPPGRPPKPESLHGRAIPHSLLPANGVPSLEERLAKLRTSGSHHTRAASSGSAADLTRSNGSSVDPSFRMPSPSDHISNRTRNNIVPAPSRPLGPRGMQTSNAPPHPPKLPLDTHFGAQFAQMPKPPEATYSPARNMATPHGVNPPRSTARSTVGTGARSNSLVVSSVSSRAPGVDADSGSYFPKSNGYAQESQARRQGTVGLPSEGRQIDPEMLFDYMDMFSLLLIDVRNRQEFDNGHIDSPATICIEPLTLRREMNDENIQETMILSPDVEQSLFSRRDQFDLIVYYDQSTTSTSFLSTPDRSSSEEALRILFDALWELYADRALKRPPLLLVGGINAWADLLGNAALKTSNTSATKASKAQRPFRRPIPVPSPATSLAVEKRRRREYNPLDPEEERRWIESARKESVYIPLESFYGEDDEEYDESDTPTTSFYRTQEDFFRRFPAVSLEQESMVTVAPQRTGAQYPTVQPPSQTPFVPTYALNGSPGELPSRPAPVAPRFSYSGAHERTVAPYSARARSAELEPYIPQRDMPHNTLLPKTGLINFGVTCYMNSTIQVLSATLPLTAIFKDNTYERFVQRDNWRGSKGVLPPHFANLIQALWANSVDACRPSTFRSLCGRLKSEWGQDQQQDAKEFLDWFLDYLHEDFNVKWRSPPPHVLSQEEEITREKLHRSFASQIEWGRYIKRDKSIVSDLFAGQHCSQLRCLKCGQTSTTYEAFFSISIEVPRSGHGDIYECLRSYCHEEKLSGDEKWVCPNCKKEREATKRITITRAPRILAIHFKRFSASRSQSARKIHTPIDFPLVNFDLSEFVLKPPTPKERAQSAATIRDPALNNKPLEECMLPPHLYNAYAVMRHLGQSVSSGHYMALVKDKGRGRWRQFNDDKVQDFDPEQLSPSQSLQNDQAYIVLFERQVGQI